MADDTPGRVAATLSPIRERQKAASKRSGATWTDIQKSQADVPRLLKAVEAVLEPHQPGRIVVLGALCRRHENHRHFSITDREAASVAACADCEATTRRICAGCGPVAIHLDECPVREAITAALTGVPSGD